MGGNTEAEAGALWTRRALLQRGPGRTEAPSQKPQSKVFLSVTRLSVKGAADLGMGFHQWGGSSQRQARARSARGNQLGSWLRSSKARISLIPFFLNREKGFVMFPMRI